MTDRSVDGLKACISSLDKIIAPVVAASGDSLAQEQVALLSRYLGFLAERMPFTSARSRLELENAVELARRTAALLEDRRTMQPDGKFELLAAGVLEADSLLQDPATTGHAMEAATARLRTSVSRVVRAMPRDSASELRARVLALVVDSGREYVDLQRAWFAPQQWENDTRAVPELMALLPSAAAAP